LATQVSNIARDKQEDHGARAEGDQIAQKAFHQHLAQHARRRGAAGQGENREHKEGGGDRYAEIGQRKQHQRRQDMPPLNAGFRIGNAVQAVKGDIAAIAEIAIQHDADDDRGGERPQHKPRAFEFEARKVPSVWITSFATMA
jgi:hypothetical protein